MALTYRTLIISFLDFFHKYIIKFHKWSKLIRLIFTTYLHSIILNFSFFPKSFRFVRQCHNLNICLIRVNDVIFVIKTLFTKVSTKKFRNCNLFIKFVLLTFIILSLTLKFLKGKWQNYLFVEGKISNLTQLPCLNGVPLDRISF